MKTIFLRALESEDKAAALRMAIRERGSALGRQRFEIDTLEFSSIPTSPFAYWVSQHIRKLFDQFPQFESQHPERRATKGLATTDDGQFLRVWWELQPQHVAHVWYSFARGGRTSPFYSDLSTYVLWQNEGARLKAFLDQKIGKYDQWSRWINSTNYYGRAGVTWALRAPRFSPQALPRNSVFSVRGYAAFSDEDALGPMLAVFNSSVFDYLFKLALGRFGHPEFVVGVLQWLPWADSGLETVESQLRYLACRAWSAKRSIDTRIEMSHAFTLPALLQVEGNDLSGRSASWAKRLLAVNADVSSIQEEIDNVCFGLYGIDEADHRSITESYRSLGNSIEPADIHEEACAESDEDGDSGDNADTVSLAAELMSWMVGVSLGRFDVRLATGARSLPADPEPFDALPVCSPAMLTGDEGLPLPVAPCGYPIAFPENGILVDDPGQARDLTAAVRVVFDTVFNASADAWWNEAAALLEPQSQDLRVWLARNYFEHHLKRYSKSRRKAPIIWQLAVPSGRYSVWLYAHRLTPDSFFQIQNDVVVPKLLHEERQLTNLMQTAGPNPSASERKEIAAQDAFVEELRAMLDEVKRLAPLWSPMLDDGVVLTMAPLWRLVPQHKPWQKELKSKWDELAAGKYDWAHFAMHLWPERVIPKCTTDRSLAIAHGLEESFWEKADDGKWKPRSNPPRSVGELVRERTSVAVKSALKSLLEAPVSNGKGGRGRGRRTANAASDGGAG